MRCDGTSAHGGGWNRLTRRHKHPLPDERQRLVDFASGFVAGRDYTDMKTTKELVRWIDDNNQTEQDPIVRRSMVYLWLLLFEQDTLQRGAAECREMMACFVECGGHPEIAASIRANWSARWGVDPNRR